MSKLRVAVTGCAAVLMLVGACRAEDAPPPKFYKLEFVVKEVDGIKVLNSRAYSVTVATPDDHACQIRTGSKFAIHTGGSDSQFTFMDVGVSVDCYHVKEAPNALTLEIHADVSSVSQESANAPNLPPVVRQNKWSSRVIVPLKKPTVIYSSDDLTSKHQMQLELTATPIT